MSGISSDAAHRLGIRNALFCAPQLMNTEVPETERNGGTARVLVDPGDY
jgi:hypothetical protein